MDPFDLIEIQDINLPESNECIQVEKESSEERRCQPHNTRFTWFPLTWFAWFPPTESIPTDHTRYARKQEE